MNAIPDRIRKKRDFFVDSIYLFVFISVVGLIYSIAVSSIAMGVAIFIFLLLVVFSKDRIFPKTSLDLFVLSYILVEILATLFSVERYSSFINMKRLFLIMFLYLALMTVNTDFKLRFILIGLVSATVLASLIEIVQQISFGEHLIRASTFQHYMTEGGIKMIVILFLIPFLINSTTTKGWKLFAIMSILPLFFGLVLTQTRSSWFGFIAGCITIGILKNRKFIFLVVSLVVLFLLFAPSDFRSRAFSVCDPTLTSNQARINMIVIGWKMFLDRPLFGYGDIDLKEIYVTYTNPIDPAEGGHLHNNFMMLLVTLGVVGFIVVMALFVKIFQVEIKALHTVRGNWLLENITLGCIAVYVGFHVNGLFEWNFGDHEIAVLLWSSIGLALASQEMIKKRKLKVAS